MNLFLVVFLIMSLTSILSSVIRYYLRTRVFRVFSLDVWCADIETLKFQPSPWFVITFYVVFNVLLSLGLTGVVKIILWIVCG